MRLQPPDQLSTCLIWLSAIFMAVRQGFESWPVARVEFPAMNAGWLNFVPIGLLSIAFLKTLFNSGNRNAPISKSPEFNEAPNFSSSNIPDSVKVEYLKLKISKHTSLQEIQFLSPYEGKWIDLSGIIADIKNDGKNVTAQIYHIFDKNRSSVIWANFGNIWQDHFIYSKKGDEIKFKGRIKAKCCRIPTFVDCRPI